MINNKLNKRENNKQYVIYIKNTSSNIFFSIYKKIDIKKNRGGLRIYDLVKVFSCGHFKSPGNKKNSIITINNLAIKSSLFILEKGIQYVHIIINSTINYKKFILQTILSTKYKNTKLKLISLIDLTHYSYTKYKIKKDKRR